jgi:hypothetical protein
MELAGMLVRNTVHISYLFCFSIFYYVALPRCCCDRFVASVHVFAGSYRDWCSDRLNYKQKDSLR